MDLELPDGTVVQGIPDGLTKAQITNKLVANGYGKNLSGAKDVEMADPTRDMSGVQKFLSGAGKAGYDLARGVGQIAGVIPESSVAESRQRDAPLMKTGAGIAGNIVGGAAALAPTALIPGANTYAGASLVGAASGALQPTVGNESRIANAGIGAGAGVTGQAAGNFMGRVMRPVATRLNPEAEQLAQAAQREGIKLTAGQRTGSRPLQITESVLENLPFTSGSQLAGREAQQRAFTAAALRRGGINADTASPVALMAQKKALGGALGDIAERGSLDMNPVVGKLSSITGDANAHLPPDVASKISGTVDQILSQIDNKGVMTGTNYQGWREPLRALADNSAPGRYYGQIRKALDEGFKSQLQGAEGQVFSDTSRKYANLKTIIDSLGGSGNLAATGQVPPTQLASALARAVGKENKTLGAGDLNELAKIGQVFVRDQIPNSGTAQRQLVQSLMTGGGGAGIGAIAGAATGHSPMEGAVYGAGVGAAGLIAPKVAQSIMNSKIGQAYLTRGIVPINDMQRKALSAAIRSLAISGSSQQGQQ